MPVFFIDFPGERHDHRDLVIQHYAPRFRGHSALCDVLRSRSVMSIRHTHPSGFRHFSFTPGNSVLFDRILGVIFSAPRAGITVATYRVRRGNPETLGGTAAYRQMAPESPERTQFVDATSAKDVVMSNDAGKMSILALERATQLSEKAILWSLITTVFVVGIAMIKGIPGL